MASSDQVEARVQYPRLGAGKYKVEAIAVPSLPAIINVSAECVILACQPIRIPARGVRIAAVDGRTTGVSGSQFGLLVVIATPEDSRCECVDMPKHDSGYCPQCGLRES